MHDVETDHQIESAFRRTYVHRTYLKDDLITCVVVAGVATLTGTVTEESHKVLAEETLVSLAGVNRVDNQLTTAAESGLDSNATTVLDLAGRKSDIWIARRVKLALLFHRNVSAHATTITVVDGVVTLEGEATSATQRELTAAYATDIEGVQAVHNAMTVAASPDPIVRTVGEKMDDASITAQVRTALLTHHSTSSFATTVEVRNGDVTVTGIAANAAEKALVSKLVSDINGVSEVKNRMTVAEVPVA
jgi:hyperosmotically inducible periplasmic protein